MRKTFFLPAWIILMAFTTQCSPQPSSEADMARLYNESHRPQFHFSPKQKWMNDPNGMVYYDGEYHLFYQHYPDSTVWGPTHWGHAVTTDLVQWNHLTIALYPDTLGYIFSGSAVIDRENTTGFQVDEHPPMVAIFTQHDATGRQAGLVIIRRKVSPTAPTRAAPGPCILAIRPCPILGSRTSEILRYCGITKVIAG